MPGFQFRDKDKERWAAAAAAAVSAAALTVRKRMAAGIGSGAKLPAAGSVYDPAWWGAAMEDHVYDPFFTIGHEAAEKFVAGTELEVDDDRLLQLALGVAAGGVFLLSHRSDVIEERVSELVTKGNDEDWEAEKLAAQLGVEDGEIPGPVSEGIASTISIAATTNLTGAAADAVIEETKAVGLKTWTCLFHNSRQSHMDADGQTVGVGELFEIGDSKGRFPGDPDLPVEEVAGCNCWLTYEVVAPAREADEDLDEAIAASGPGDGAAVGIALANSSGWLTEIETNEDSVVFDVGVGGPPGTVTYREAVDPEWGNHALVVTEDGWPVSSIIWRPLDGGIEGLFIADFELMVELVMLAEEIALELGDEPPNPEVEVSDIVYATFGGPGSGPRPGYKKAKQDRLVQVVSQLNDTANPPSEEPPTAEDKARLTAVRDEVFQTNAGLVLAAQDWQKKSAGIRKAADEIVGAEGRPLEGREVSDLERMNAEYLLEAVSAAPPIEGTLYRGLAMAEIPQPGQVIDDPLGSWSASDDIATYVVDKRVNGTWYKPDGATNAVILEGREPEGR